MYRTTMAVALTVALTFGTLAACGSPSTPAASQQPSSAETSASQPSVPQDRAEVTSGADSIVVKGSGKAEVGPISFGEAYYLVKVTNGSAGEFGSILVTEAGKELPSIMTTSPTSVVVYRPSSSTMTLAIEASGTFTLEFTKPPVATAAVSAPQTFTGAAGTTVTPVVKTKGTYVNLAVTYTGTPDPNGSTGTMLASATLYDAVTGESVMNAKYVNKVHTESSDGNTRPAPGVYFAIVTGSTTADTWKVEIRETSS